MRKIKLIKYFLNNPQTSLKINTYILTKIKSPKSFHTTLNSHSHITTLFLLKMCKIKRSKISKISIKKALHIKALLNIIFYTKTEILTK